MSPCVSVLMSAYNAEKFIDEAIESILNQSFEDFEFIIVDDCSSDDTRQIIEKYSTADTRIKTIFNSTNLGQSVSLNKGIEITEGKYIARMDADDLSLSHRLKTQVEFMETNPNIAVSSAWMETFGQENGTVRRSPVTHQEIVTELFTRNCLWHPVAIIRKDLLDSLDLRYDPNYVKGQDYKLWTEFSRFCELANIPKVLLKYRVHEEQKTQKDLNPKKDGANKSNRIKERNGIHQMLLTDFLSREPTQNEVILHAKLFFQIPFHGKDELAQICEWINFLKSENSKIKKYIEPNFSNLLDAKFHRTKARSFKHYTASDKRFSPKLLWELFFSSEQYYRSFSVRELMHITLNSLAFRKNRWYSGEDSNVNSWISG